jgi:serine/threonine protein kinase
MDQMVDLLRRKYGLDGARVDPAIQLLFDSNLIPEDLKPALKFQRYSAVVPIDQENNGVPPEIRKAINQEGREVVFTFELFADQMRLLQAKLNTQQKEIISSLPRKNFLQRQEKKGHAVVLYDFGEKGCLRFKNSWGVTSGFRGKFSVSNPTVLGLVTFYDIFFVEEKLTQKYKVAFSLYLPFGFLPFLSSFFYFLHPISNRFQNLLREWKSMRIPLPDPVPLVDNSLIVCSNKLLGKGVYSGTFNGTPAAIKTIYGNIDKIKDINYSFHHRNIIRSYGYYVKNSDHKGMVIVYLAVSLETLTLQHLLEHRRSSSIQYSPDASRFIILDVLRGLSHIHAYNIIHGDIHPSNILIGFNGTAKLGDLGSAVQLDTWNQTINAHRGYLPPEIEQSLLDPRAKRDLVLTNKVDIYMLGMIMKVLKQSEFPGYDKISHVIHACKNTDPSCRPDCQELKHKISSSREWWDTQIPEGKLPRIQISGVGMASINGFYDPFLPYEDSKIPYYKKSDDVHILKFEGECWCLETENFSIRSPIIPKPASPDALPHDRPIWSYFDGKFFVQSPEITVKNVEGVKQTARVWEQVTEIDFGLTISGDGLPSEITGTFSNSHHEVINGKPVYMNNKESCFTYLPSKKWIINPPGFKGSNLIGYCISEETEVLPYEYKGKWKFLDERMIQWTVKMVTILSPSVSHATHNDSSGKNVESRKLANDLEEGEYRLKSECNDVVFEKEQEKLSSIIQDTDLAVLRDVAIESLSRKKKKEEPTHKSSQDTNPAVLPRTEEQEKPSSTQKIIQSKPEQKEQKTLGLLPTNADAEVHHEPEVTILMLPKGRNPMPPMQVLEPSHNEIKLPSTIVKTTQRINETKVEQEVIAVDLPHPIITTQPSSLTEGEIMSRISGNELFALH